MRLRSFNTLFYSVALLLISRRAQSARNQTVDDTSPDITYTGTWLTSTTRTDRINSTTHYTKVQGSYATFSFSGVSALYFIGYGLTVKNVGSGTIIDLVFDGVTSRVNQHRDTYGQALMWSSGPIDATQTHTIVCRKTSVDDSGFDLNIDAFILTIPDEISTSATASTGSDILTSTSSTGGLSSLSSSLSASFITTTISGTTYTLPAPSVVWIPTDDSNSTGTGVTSASTSSPSTASSTGPLTGAIAGGVVGAVVLLGLVALFFFLLGRRNRKAVSSTSGYVSDKGLGSTSGGATSIERITGDTELNNLAPTNIATSTPLRTEKRGREQGATVHVAIRSVASDGNSQSGLPTNVSDELDMASQTWITSPPAYDQLAPASSSRPLSSEKM